MSYVDPQVNVTVPGGVQILNSVQEGADIPDTSLQSILAWVAELANSRFRAFAQIDVKRNGSHPIFVGI